MFRLAFGRARKVFTTSFALALALAAAAVPACQKRPVSAGEPTTKTQFTAVVPQPAIDKVDLLLMIDNSSSMADKQKILADALPDLLHGLVQPRCVDERTREPVGVDANPLAPEGAQCPSGAVPAFTPITDMHIGVVSSSLGGLGYCKDGDPTTPNADDHGHLLARGEKGPVAAAGDLHFLAWYPEVAANQDKHRHPDPPVPKTTKLADLESAFRDLVVGVDQRGCGLEAQLESVYHFLVQPDPWQRIVVSGGTASYGPEGEVDDVILRQRAAFLRPDSLVAVIMLTDEDDSFTDPLALSGSGWRVAEASPMPRPTSACAADPASRACTSCGLKCLPGDDACLASKNDPSCAINGGYYMADDDRRATIPEDDLNVRFHEMKRRYGVDPQFPIARYVQGFTSEKVPRRASEHDGGGVYVGKADCTNPLFAAKLPTSSSADLCKLPRGPRPKELVYFALLGGVPNALLPTGANGAIDWTRILGRDPTTWDETGIDPHMLASLTPRPGLPAPSAKADADPIHGREWTTKGRDLQYACTFDLYERAATGNVEPVRRVCDETNKPACDCDGAKDSPVCDPQVPNVQVKGKAYPTRRELMVARELEGNGVVASLCPKQLTQPGADDYGYRPAARSIVERLERGLVGACVPSRLERDAAGGDVPCLVMATLPDPGPDSDCQRLYGLPNPPADVLASYRNRLAADEGDEATLLPVCQIPSIVVPAGESCKNDTRLGYCYVEHAPGIGCERALVFSRPTAALSQARFSMECITRSGEP